MTLGSCLCGAVRYEIEGPYQWMTHCHCSMCRKHHGALFGTSLGVKRENFRWLQGEDAIVHYRSSPTFERPFCGQCGSAVPDTSDSAMVACPAGGLADDLEEKPRAHIFVGSKSPLHEISDELRRFEEYPPGYGTPVTSSPAAAEPEGDTFHGSCLCGAVAFAVDERPRNLVNCHCSRCRKSRGTAHGTNFFARIEKFRWTRGADKVRTYKVPDASLFATGFCGDCGSQLPAAFTPIKRYIVPVGAMDTPLPLKVGVNIWVGSKAPWYEVSDGLPQFEEMPPQDRVREVMF